MSSEAKQEVKQVSEIQYVKSKIEHLTDLTSFNAYGVATLSDNQKVNIQWTIRHGVTLEELKADAIKTIAFYDWLATDQGVQFWDGSKNGDKAAPVNGKEPRLPHLPGERSGTGRNPFPQPKSLKNWQT